MLCDRTEYSVQNTTNDSMQTEGQQQYTIVFNKRRGCCADCVGDCSYYKGIGGPCNECGCYPARHVDLDAPKNSLKRTASQAGMNEGQRESKRPRFLLGTLTLHSTRISFLFHGIWALMVVV